MRRQIEVPNEVAAALSGANDQILRALEGHVDCKLYLRGNVITLDGDAEAVAAAGVVVRELSELIEQGHEIAEGTIAAVTDALDQHESPAEVLEDVVWRHRSTKVAPKTVNQKRYVDSIRRNTITFGIGPAGTGKTFLAVAMAAAALSRREVNRIILTRPAVEAGERLGFLPGDLMAKIDPYLRPLFDALHDMIDPEKVATHLERNVIEVAPLAFMRGRAQPVDRSVLTPDGWQPIGSLRIGDLVIGSNGRPTPVLGAYPQGRRQVFRVQSQDGASTLCCGEHLWTVRTPDDRRRGTQRTLRTDEMLGRLRTNHQHRFELPVLSAPVEFEPQDVPIEPYALGLLLGDGCLTATTTPTFATADDRARRGSRDAAARHRAQAARARSTTSCGMLTGIEAASSSPIRSWPRCASSGWPAHDPRPSSCLSSTCTTRPLSGSACSRGSLTATAARCFSVVARLASSTRRAPRSCATTWSFSFARSAAWRLGADGGPRVADRAGARSSRPPSQRRVHPRHPAAGLRGPLPPEPQARPLPREWRRTTDAIRHSIEPAGEATPSASRSPLRTRSTSRTISC